jgi:hypothetical protein
LANAWTLRKSPDDMEDEEIEDLMEKVISRVRSRRVK